jgi:hypothetical protein
MGDYTTKDMLNFFDRFATFDDLKQIREAYSIQTRLLEKQHPDVGNRSLSYIDIQIMNCVENFLKRFRTCKDDID